MKITCKSFTKKEFATEFVHVKDGPNVGRQRSGGHDEGIDEHLSIRRLVIGAVGKFVRLVDLIIDNFADGDGHIVTRILVIVLQAVKQLRKPEPQTVVTTSHKHIFYILVYNYDEFKIKPYPN